jgi:malic enzyme
LIAFLKTLQRLKQEWQKNSAETRQTDGKNLVWFGERKKISQVTNAYLYSPLFLSILLCKARTKNESFCNLNKLTASRVAVSH